ncbi:hypothetical protein SLEP1_g28937 [Rubroshorea leprosula]|uniref:Uncharacterized protein n=1 Tax=Rubroshorea leprosula TaxID=152421 RepID=A0AAV5K4P0_9ROSI|nr:hypothetical protein SLEP1_g28937 [Rubroshorea leprosula]
MAADRILGSVLDATLSKVISVVNEQLNVAIGFEEELRRFDGKLKMIQGVLQDAEQKGMVGDPVLKSWLEGLRSQAEEADDMMDEIAYENLRCKVAQMSEKVSYFSTLFNPLAFRLKMANRIKSLNLELDGLNKIATDLGLQQRLASKHPEHIETQQTDSLIDDPSKFVGRENKVLEVVESLIDSSNDQPLLVVSIVGMGGIGKTTVAKLVLEMLQACGENVSVDVNQDIVVQKLQEKLREEKLREEKLREEKLREEKLREKNYLLILDDVWNEDWQKWESLRSCLLGIGKKVGSRVLITTRSENVASTVVTLSKHMHHLEKLTDEDCWYIIKQRAFVSSSVSSELEGIGRDIASKCGGLALVANVIGGFLCNNMKKDDWLSIKDNSEVWGSIEEANGVLRVLQLSFNRLPIPALKQCFAFCSIFPKDFVMGKEMLIQLWMAEGFLQPFSETHLEMEDVGDKYFNALSSYSLFQNVERDPYGSIITCKMHDLINDLAQSVSKSQTLILEDGSGRNIPANIQHLNVISDKDTTTTKLGDVPKNLHTLFSQIDVFHSMSTNLKKVRVLSFCGANIDELPAFLEKMKHLRIVRPLEGIWDLLNLRHICFNDEKLMPAGIGRLTCLKTLQLFVVGQQKGHQIEELGRLNQLRRKLEIRNLDMVRDKEEAMGARLSEKDAIQELQLVFGEESSGSEDRCTQDEDILEGLQPHSNLKGLTIECYCGKSCPSWMLETKNFLKNLMFMTFYECPWLESIPSLSLSNEAKVEIKNCKNLKSIACWFLQKLIIEECEELVGVEIGPVAMKSLKEVHIESCGKLVNLPMISKLQSLEVFELQQCKELKMIGDDAPFNSTCLQELNIQDCDSLMSIPSVDGLSSLQKINIRCCEQLKSIGEDLSTATCLKELTIWSCDGLMSFPNLHGLSSLQKIDIYNCEQLKSIGEDLSTTTCLKELTVSLCKGLMSLPNLHGLSSLQKIEIDRCRQLKSIGEDLSTAMCLKELTIQSCIGLMSLPNLHGLSSLQKIKIDNCGPLKSIGNDLSTVTCLKELTINYCDGLMSLPNLHGLSSLQKIEIYSCEQLKSIGEDLSTATCLKELTIWWCDELMSFPNLHGLSSLQTLYIMGCRGLRSLPSGLPSCTALEELGIAHFHNLISIPDDLRRSWSIPNPACLARLKKLTIGNFSTKLEEFPDLGFIGSHLEELELYAWGKPRERLLDQIQHLTALKSLEISGFDGLEALPNWFGNLSSLQTLKIHNCESLKHMEAIRCLSRLERLFIERCRELEERCTRGSGSEWDCISHIRNIKIDYRRIQWAGAPIEIPSQLHQDDDSEQQVDDNEQQDDDSEQQVDDNEQQILNSNLEESATEGIQTMEIEMENKPMNAKHGLEFY